MDIKDIIILPYQVLLNWPKKKLPKSLQILREKYKELEEKKNELENDVTVAVSRVRNISNLHLPRVAN